jgi:hypothetical protein
VIDPILGRNERVSKVVYYFNTGGGGWQAKTKGRLGFRKALIRPNGDLGGWRGECYTAKPKIKKTAGY